MFSIRACKLITLSVFKYAYTNNFKKWANLSGINSCLINITKKHKGKNDDEKQGEKEIKVTEHNKESFMINLASVQL